jgi:hypothetical protein
MCGIFVTCFRNVEAKCTNELYFLLNQAHEALTGTTDDAPEQSSLSFEDQIKSEVSELKQRKDKNFIALDTKGLQCIVFVRAIDGLNVSQVVKKLFSLIHEKSVKSIKYGFFTLYPI